MHSNHHYNLMLQAAQENKALWRIKKHYLRDAGSCKTCRAFWKKMERDKEKHVKEMDDILRHHLK